jgi:hypothetical protein
VRAGAEAGAAEGDSRDAIAVIEEAIASSETVVVIGDTEDAAVAVVPAVVVVVVVVEVVQAAVIAGWAGLRSHRVLPAERISRVLMLPSS